MTTPRATASYNPVSKLLHWLIAGLIVLQYVLAKMAENANDQGSALRELALLANHKSVGITVLILAVVRMAWRFRSPPPTLPKEMDQWQKLASHVSHWTLYGLIFLLPITGWLMSSATAYSVSWFNLIQLPDFVAPNESLAETLKLTHDVLSKLLFVVAVVHIAAAMKHHFVDRDLDLSRMSSRSGAAIFVGAIIVGVAALGSAGNSESNFAGMQAGNSADEIVVSASSLPEWTINYDTSYIRFTGDQAGAAFDGTWESWSAIMRFDSDRLGESAFEVTIDTGSVETQDDDRDTTLMDSEWFDVENHPEAFYRATDFVATEGDRYIANGQLIIKGFAAPAPLTFTVRADGDQRVLSGSANLLRLEVGVGTGEWEDTTWVSNEVTVDVRVDARVP